MKKFIYLFIIAATIVSAGCSNIEPTHTPAEESAAAVKGHTYRYAEGSNYMSLYFARNSTCTCVQNINGQFVSTSNLTYQISGTNVDIYTDNSSMWVADKRNTLLYHMIYYPSSDALIWESLVFKRYD